MASDATILANIKEAINTLISTGGAVVEWSIGGRDTKHYSLDELRRMQVQYEGIVAATATNKRRSIKLASISSGDS